ncbi:D-arabinono-1,4-lactone oxidase [Catalinimonas niigatensis]|uniref:D-arabinono-1,4-lactone oxidase n=1 Tax=Catalinimonas niigatensis TaxID=1397264 RepID=UPI002666E70A|nr:D-arabinono-1,4-lactone oxidase [Catalinimonas niigatensis]WPP50380.1 D-arabinono-1,4-lactone oxidase [Catalinimonas niigatensis]
MEKRAFLKTTSATVIGSLLTPLISCNTPQEQQTVSQEARKNWAGNLTYSTDQLYEPASVEEAQEMVKSLDKVKALGTRHCFNNIADSKVNQLSLQKLTQISIDEDANTVTVDAGVNYGLLSPYLHERGYALHNLASLPHISVAGACATATHGSGVNNGNLPSAVKAIEFISANGELVKLSREADGDKFNGAVVNLGALGVVTHLTLDIQPTFKMRQEVYLSLPVAQLEEHFDEIMSAGYSVSLFTDWKTDQVNQVWIKRKVDDTKGDAEAEFYGARLADRDVHPIIEISAENCTQQMGIAGPWYERMPHFRMDFTPSSGTELQAEYFVPRQHAVAAFQAVQTLKDQIAPLLMISEIRTIAADDFWMSPCYQQDSVAFHFTCEQDWENLQHLLPKIEEALQPYGVRPHWGKMFTMSPDRLASLYPKLTEFRNLVKEYDPQGKFSNAYLQRNILV